MLLSGVWFPLLSGLLGLGSGPRMIKDDADPPTDQWADDLLNINQCIHAAVLCCAVDARCLLWVVYSS